MRNQTKARIVKFLFIASLVICLFLISDTYAKYHDKIDINYGSVIKRWNIILNENELRDTTKTFTEYVLAKFDGNDYMDKDVIVPGSIGYFDIKLDFSKVDTPFKVDLSIEQNPNAEGTYNSLPDFKYLGFEAR